MIKQIKSILKLDDTEVDLTRRRVIQSAAALATLTIAGSKLLPAAQTKLELTFKDYLAKGVIENQIFYLDEPIVINLPNIVFRNCTFIARKALPYMLYMKENSTNCTIDTCEFKTFHSNTTGIKIEPLVNKADNTNNLQQAINALSDKGTLHLAPGDYKVNSMLSLDTRHKKNL